MLELDTKLLLLGLLVVCEFAGGSCFFPDPPAVLEPPNYKRGYQILRELSEKGASTKVRGIGKCGGVLYMFFNRPYVYIGDVEMAYDPNTRQFLLLWLDPMRVRNFKNNYQLFSEVCGSRDYCETFLDRVYFGMYNDGAGRCYMYVADRQTGVGDGEHDIAVYDLQNQLNYFDEIDFVGLKGIAFSSCSLHEPHIRFLYNGDFSLPYCNEYFENGFYSNIQECQAEARKYNSLGSGLRLTLTADNTEMNEDVAEDWAAEKVDLNDYLFGGCIDGFYYVVKSDQAITSKELEDKGTIHNYMGFRHLPFKLPEKLVQIDRFFSTRIKPEPGTPTKEPFGTPASVVVVQRVTGDSPDYGDDKWAKWATFTLILTVWPASNPSLESFLDDTNIQAAGLLSGMVLIFIWFLCCLGLLCLFLTMRGGHSGRILARRQRQDIVVRVERPRTRAGGSRHSRR